MHVWRHAAWGLPAPVVHALVRMGRGDWKIVQRRRHSSDTSMSRPTFVLLPCCSPTTRECSAVLGSSALRCGPRAHSQPPFSLATSTLTWTAPPLLLAGQRPPARAAHWQCSRPAHSWASTNMGGEVGNEGRQRPLTWRQGKFMLTGRMGQAEGTKSTPSTRCTGRPVHPGPHSPPHTLRLSQEYPCERRSERPSPLPLPPLPSAHLSFDGAGRSTPCPHTLFGSAVRGALDRAPPSPPPPFPFPHHTHLGEQVGARLAQLAGHRGQLPVLGCKVGLKGRQGGLLLLCIVHAR